MRGSTKQTFCPFSGHCRQHGGGHQAARRREEVPGDGGGGGGGERPAGGLRHAVSSLRTGFTRISNFKLKDRIKYDLFKGEGVLCDKFFAF